MRPIGFWVGFCLILGGLFLLAFTQVTTVFVDPARTEFVSRDTVGDATNVLLSAFLITVGFVSLIASISPATGWGRAGALTSLFLSCLILLSLHLTLFINAVVVSGETRAGAAFTAGYLFHNSADYGLAAVFIIFLLTVALLGVFLLSLGALILPGKFGRALWDSRDWSKNEAIVVGSGLLLVFSLSVYLVAIVEVLVRLGEEPPNTGTALGQNLPILYTLLVLAVGALILTVAARVFLVNWGVQTPLDPTTIRDSLHNVLRVERVLVGVALVLDILIWMAPPVGDTSSISSDPVFLLNSRGLAAFFLLLAVPFLAYAMGLRGLNRLLRDGHPLRTTPFSHLSLRMVIIDLGGLILLTAIGSASGWNALGLMATYAAWTAGVFLFASVRVQVERGLWEAELRGRGAPPLFFGFLLLSLATGLMMWGAGNTYVGTYEGGDSKLLNVENASPYGAELLFRVGGACLLAFTILFGLAVARNAMGIKRSLVGAHVATFFTIVLVGILTFSVSVWNKGERGLEDAYAGYAFHQFYDLEKWLVGGLVLIGSLVVLWSLSRLIGPLVRGRPTFTYAPRVR